MTPKIIALASTKGGVSKSSLAVALAGIAATEYDKRVLLVDADENGGSSGWFALGGQDAPYDIDTSNGSDGKLARLRTRTDYDLIVVDLPGFRGQSLIDIVLGSAYDLLVIPTRANPLDVAPLRSLVPAITGDYRVVFTMTTPGRDPDVDAYRAAFAAVGWKIATTSVRQSKGWPRAAQEARLVTTGSDFPTARTDARALAAELLETIR